MFNRFSTYSRPVNIRFPKRFQLPPQDFVLRMLSRRVVIYDLFGYRTDILQQLTVTGDVRNLQIEGNAALLRTLQITGTAQFQIRFRYFKAVIRTHHYFQPFPSLFGQLVIRHQDTIRLFGTAPHPATQLMEL